MEPIETLQLDDRSTVTYQRKFVPDSRALAQYLRDEIPWRTVTRTIYGTTFDTPRLQCFMGDADVAGRAAVYQKQPPLPWSPLIMDLKLQIEEHLAARGLHVRFNYVLLNQYRDGRDKITWHRDNEASEEGKNIIASVSFGATRKFIIKKHPLGGSPVNTEKHTFHLEDGSLLVMSGDTQLGWVHTVPVDTHVQRPRINLTFRVA